MKTQEITTIPLIKEVSDLSVMGTIVLTVFPKMAMKKKCFSEVASLIRIHLISLINVFELLKSPKRNHLAKDHHPKQVIQRNFSWAQGGV